MSDLQAWIQIVRDGGLALAVVVLVIGGMRGWYHWDMEYREMKQDRDDWRRLALQGTYLAERALEAPSPLRK